MAITERASGARAIFRQDQVFLLMVVLAVGLYVPTIQYSFVADDHIYLGLGNSSLVKLGVSDLWMLFAGIGNAWEFLPVRDFTYWLDVQIFGDAADGFHASNLAWYVACIGGAYWAAREAWLLDHASDREAAHRFGLAVAAVFAVHPMHVEAVAWIAGRKDVLAAGFLFAAWAVLVRCIRSGTTPGSLTVLFGLLTLACWSKSTATVSVAILVLSLLATKGSRPALDRRGAVVLALAMAVAAGLWLAVHHRVAVATGIAVENDPDLFDRVDRASRLLAGHLRMVLLPFDSRLFRDPYSIGLWHWGASIAAVLAGALATVMIAKGRHRLTGFALLWTLVPLSSFLQFAPFSTWSMLGERFVFVSSFGVSLLLAVWALRLRRYVLLAVVAICVGSGMLSGLRIADWRLEDELFEREVRLDPGHYVAARWPIAAAVDRRDWSKAETMASQVRRDDARQVLHRFIAFRRAMREAAVASTPEADASYCRVLRDMDVLLNREFERLGQEKDMAYSSFLRNTARTVYPVRSVAARCRVIRRT